MFVIGLFIEINCICIYLELEEVECAVCKDNFEEGNNVIELPCNHLFHPDCILPWLENVRIILFY